MPNRLEILHSYTAVLCAKFQNDLVTDLDVIDVWGFTSFEFKMGFGGNCPFSPFTLIFLMPNVGHHWNWEALPVTA